MDRYLKLLIALFLLSGCVAPGSSPTEIDIVGYIHGKDLKKLYNQEVKIEIGDQYGTWGEERNGIPKIKAKIGKDGKFFAKFGLFRHITYWLLPPLGSRPKNPPPPYFSFYMPNKPNELYYIWMVHDKIKYLFYDINKSSKRVDPQQAFWKIESGKFYETENSDKNKHVDRWTLSLDIIQN